ncbi:hypothetical protein SAMN06265795_10343 [Noviherbaspirillum humi]|uniref:Uncharacterized protein n=1 Tax=Noviherbaspirillum humi TaxID=1688639 RepID=A0A239EVW5_9BURK|nr:DUF2863 family protein [Noviherbaspirillum humi]SNS48759.1 hypothetical protein SAMN06265795_10343 [Noviherbaspirillum humi]
MLASPGTTTAPSAAALQRDAKALAQAARRFAQKPGSDDAGEFEALLQRVLSRPEPYESDVISEAVNLLLSSGHDDCIAWLLEEVEMESELQFIRLGKSGPTRACVLFAIPVVFPAFTEPSATPVNSAAFQELHDILEEQGIIGEEARFRLLPRLFTPQELRGRPYGDFMRLTRHLAVQLAQPHETDVSADGEAFPPPAVVMTPLQAAPYVTLRYLVGLALTTEEGLNELFPPLDDDADEGGETAGDGNAPGQAPGRALAQAIEDWSGAMQGVLDVGAPMGLHADVRFGFELAREHNCRLQLKAALDNAALTLADAALAEFPLAGEDGEVIGIRLLLLDGDDRALEEMPWLTLPHESLDEAIDKLHLVLTEEGYAPADELLSGDGHTASYLLH